MKANTFARFRAILMSLVIFCPCIASLSADQYGLFTYRSYWTVSLTFVVEITDYPTTATGHVYIPAYINGVPVVRIRPGAFQDCSGLTGVTIPYNVVLIEAHAFSGCSGLTSVTIPSSVTNIEDSAFEDCRGLTSVTIPSSVSSVQSSAFSGCTRLTAIFVDAANPGYSSVGGVLFNKLQTSIIQCPPGRAGAYTIPSSVTTIEARAFWGCNGLTSVTIPSSVTNIMDYSFYGCSGLTALLVDAAHPGYSSVDGVLFNKPQTSLVLCPPGRAGAHTIPSSVTSIMSYAFSGCSGLTSVTIPSSVTSIGYSAFSGCSGLTRVTIPSSVTSIGNVAFRDCSGLTTATFLGDAPSPRYLPLVFSGAAGFTIYYLSGSSGFTSPTWGWTDGPFIAYYSTVEIDQSVYPAAAWLLTHNLSSETDLHQDLNGDGITLLTSYALNLDPNNPAMPMPVLDPATMSMTFYGVAQGVTYGAETSTDLQEWVTAGVTISDIDPANMRTATVNRDSGIRFLRLTFGLGP